MRINIKIWCHFVQNVFISFKKATTILAVIVPGAQLDTSNFFVFALNFNQKNVFSATFLRKCVAFGLLGLLWI